jgi:hypothetical protein
METNQSGGFITADESTTRSVTSMHEVTPLDKETQPNLEDVEVGDKVPMAPSADEGDKNLRPEAESDVELP